MITNFICYPLTTALYGQRIRQPTGGDFAFSNELARHYAEAADLQDRGDYARAAEVKNQFENISWVLYPNDSTPAGRELRLRQEYFFTSASIQDIVARHLAEHHGLGAGLHVDGEGDVHLLGVHAEGHHGQHHHLRAALPCLPGRLHGDGFALVAVGAVGEVEVSLAEVEREIVDGGQGRLGYPDGDGRVAAAHLCESQCLGVDPVHSRRVGGQYHR